MERLLDHHPALGTAWWIEAQLSPEHSFLEIKEALIARLTTFEARYSRFRPDSLVSELNTKRVYTNPDDEFLAIMHYGQSLYSRTHSMFNFLFGDTLAARGYGTAREVLSSEVPPHPEHDLIITDSAITLLAGGIDFGGFGKGYLIDELATLLRERGVTDFLINGGGDLYASSENGNPFTIHLEHPTEADTYLGTTTLHNQGFAASSPYKRTWKNGEKTETHIVGATEYATFVIATSARDADAFATAALFLNDDTLRVLTSEENIGIARFHPTTSELSVTNFSITPL